MLRLFPETLREIEAEISIKGYLFDPKDPEQTFRISIAEVLKRAGLG